MNNPDTLVEWDLVEQVVGRSILVIISIHCA